MCFPSTRLYSCIPYMLNGISRQVTSLQNTVFSHQRHKVSKQCMLYQQYRFSSQDWDHDVDDVLNDKNYQEFSDRIFRLPPHGHKVLVLQPFIRNQNKSDNTNSQLIGEKTRPELQLEEAKALIDTLPRWKAVESSTFGMLSFNRRSLFGPGQIDKIKELLYMKKEISAVFVSINILRVIQIMTLERALNVPVYDRYTIVIQIFRQHAVTNESKLQVAMAEIPYLKQCVKGFPKGLSDRLFSGNIVGTERTLPEKRRDMLIQREQKLKKAIGFLRKHREKLRNNLRMKSSYPTLAVMGYTNAGKTSLIKALTGADKLKPRNQLFATLDVTKHEGVLPCNLKVLYVDTVGFITDIPTELLESFTATLEDAIHADVVIHIWDVSNPDFRMQRQHVMTTLANLNFGENISKKIFVIGNKVDQISKDVLSEMEMAEKDTYFVSAKTGYGMEKMLYALQEKVIKDSGWMRMKIRVKTGGEEYRWLQAEVAIEDSQIESDSAYSILTVVISKARFEIFKNQFVNKK